MDFCAAHYKLDESKSSHSISNTQSSPKSKLNTNCSPLLCEFLVMHILDKLNNLFNKHN